jgi:hypothetical protein
MPFHMYILNFLQCNVFAQKKLVAMTFEVTHVCVISCSIGIHHIYKEYGDVSDREDTC